jgi:3-isopropylmalate/(R)-2-methylmalate dehydratase large subunit
MPTMIEKIWDAHVVARLPGDHDLLHVDRHLVHDLGGPAAFAGLARRGLPVRNPELTFATTDHCVSSAPGRRVDSNRTGAKLIPLLRQGCADHAVRLFDMAAAEQGIVHVIGPELGLTLPGSTVVCGDSHTCTNGALGALAWGLGTSEVIHVLATQCVVEKPPRQLLVEFTGTVPTGVFAKDLVLHLIAREGTDLGLGHAVEYGGPVVRAMSLEARMTLCNLAVELGSKMGAIAPDDSTFEYVAGRRFAPSGEDWDRAIRQWRTLPSDEDADWHRRITVDVTGLAPQVSWGITPSHTIGVDARIPHPHDAPDGATRAGWERAYEYMDLVPGAPILGTPIQRVFIGSCANARLSDLEAAAAVVRGRRVDDRVDAWVVPGSQAVKRDAESRGLRDTFEHAGFHWRESGCSMCLATNEEYVAPGERCVSTSNRNFVGRQGPGARTHLASPATAAASAIVGAIADVRAVS